MAKRRTEDAETTEDADIMAVVESTNPQSADPTDAENASIAKSAETMKETGVAHSPAAEPRNSARGGAFVAMMLGGAVAAFAGFGLARAFPEIFPTSDVADLRAIVTSQGQEIETLKSDLAARPDLESLVARLAALEAAPTPASAAEIEDRVAALQAAVAELKSNLASDNGTAVSALVAEVSALRDRVEALGTGGSVPADVLAAASAAEQRLQEAEARAASLAQEAEVAAAATRRAAALDRISAALDSGSPYSSALSALGQEVPKELSDNASAGLPTMADLVEEFPEVARQSLEDALRANLGESWTDRVSTFLRSQTGLRSLSPKEGSDPDAILSRAEAELRSGNLATAISELAAMPEPGKAALAEWIAKATTRVNAEAALAALAQN